MDNAAGEGATMEHTILSIVQCIGESKGNERERAGKLQRNTGKYMMELTAKWRRKNSPRVLGDKNS